VTIVVTIDPADASAIRQIAEAFAVVAGRRVRLTVSAGGELREFEGVVPRRSQWRAPEDPCLMLRPGTTDSTHVLAAMALHVRVVDGQVVLARRRHYEEEAIDFQRLPAGPVELRLETQE
jgi:hypothetical protein